MINEKEVLQLIIDTYPKARDYLILEADEWVPEKGSGGKITAHSLLSVLSGLVVKEFVSSEYDSSVELFELIERFVSVGDSNVSNAACTCFIENLQNTASNDNEFEYSHFVSLLGPKSREYAKSWDDFTGVKTEGLK
jgi:hypothetical protein